jgi:hypothetical protein
MPVSLIPSPPQPSPIGAGTYTTWPGGVDPTARLFNTDNTDIPCTGTKGGRRKASRRTAKRRVSKRKDRRQSRRCWSRRR